MPNRKSAKKMYIFKLCIFSKRENKANGNQGKLFQLCWQRCRIFQGTIWPVADAICWGKLSSHICAFRPSVPPLRGSNSFKLISNCFLTANDVAKFSGQHPRWQGTRSTRWCWVGTQAEATQWARYYYDFSCSTIVNIHDQGAAFRSVWAVIGSSAKSEQNMVVINMYRADDENSIQSWLKMQWTAMIHPGTSVQT